MRSGTPKVTLGSPAATVIALVLVVVAPACSAGEESARTSDERPAPTTTAPGEERTENSTDEGAGDEGSSDEGSGDQGSGDQGSGDEGSGDEGSDLSIPDLDDLTETIPGLGELGDCMEIAAAYGSLYFEALGGADGAEEAQRKADELKSVLPEDLHDDIDVIADAIGEVAEQGIVDGSEALSSPEYQAADQAINDYLAEQCGGTGGTPSGGGQGES